MIFESLAKMTVQGGATTAGMLAFGGVKYNDTVGVFGQRENIKVNKKFEERASMISSSLISGATLAGVLYAINGDFVKVSGIGRLFVIGAGSEVAGSFVSSLLDIEEE
jgi:hypothetical protein